ncbi:MAG: pyridoxamine 5'-phosphate oxidase family protein [Syntrophobacteraceae bacterium]|jgi:nitroimidazol reductase NimA-like FMN-containing flavoprotein (pyridoxamine 5'-phosphate oxidase superfamily)|nr:pyridoxamine 5'-phosphate oxidase family protein [Syntrophobacteraceae bacterium]
MLDRMKNLLKAGDMCVLATCAENRPHCSLMAYITDEVVETVYMVTLKDSQKFRNIRENPEVSLLVDTRQDIPVLGRKGVKALTVHGTCRPLPADEGRPVLGKLAGRHPHLEPLIVNPQATILEVKVQGFLLLDGVSDAHYEPVSS